MVKESDRDLRGLAKRYRITFKPPGSADQWPAAHRTTFENIRAIGEQRLDKFYANIDIHSNDQPWRKQTKNRAEWLAKRATQLFNQQRNEAGWRFGLENDVLQRFSFEVACPKCRARIWRSEVEAYIKESDGAAVELEERRRNRTECHCAPEYRPLDYYEIGTNPLFDDRTQEVIVHDALLRSELPKQEPDRVYGLQATRNFQKLLSKSAINSSTSSGRPSIGEIIRTSPFKEGVEPLLFPFLILEAKSEKSCNGFGDIQTQTAFPILALLKLQEDLQAKVEDGMDDASPLVWFFANRGDAWRVYGCYVTADNPTRYDIIQLWSGCIMTGDDALRLLLIVDYVFDWARDVYRPSILRQLKSLTIGEAYDQVSQVSDSDIFSLGRNISNWIQPPPSAADELDMLRPTLLIESHLSEEDLADTCCVLYPASPPAYRATALIHEETPQNTISTDTNARIRERASGVHGDIDFELAAPGIISWKIILRLSANLKDPVGGFHFGRNKQLCDFVIDGHNKRISNIHFKVYVNTSGALTLEDLSRNGTAVDGTYLCGKDENGMNHVSLEQGSIIVLSMTPPEEDYRFVVRIPQRDHVSENAYQQNLTAFFLRMNNFGEENESRNVATSGGSKREPISLFPAPGTITSNSMSMTSVSRSIRKWNGGPKYNKLGCIGKGDFAVVYLITAKFDGVRYAAKELEKRRFLKNGVLDKNVDMKIKIMGKIQHSNVVQYIEIVDWGDYFYIIMEYLPNGDLGSLINRRGPLKEQDVKLIAGQLLGALKYIHHKGITHRDVKPENILIDKLGQFKVKLTGFGLSMIGIGETSYEFCSTVLYCAPELCREYGFFLRGVREKSLLHQRCDHPVDIWSLAGVLFFALCGSPPYPAKNGTSYRDLFNRIMMQVPDIRPLQRANISKSGIRFIQSMLHIDPDRRATIGDLQYSSWFAGGDKLQVSIKEEDVDMIGGGVTHPKPDKKEATELSIHQPDARQVKYSD